MSTATSTTTSSTESSAECELIKWTGRLLDAIADGEWSAYAGSCDPTLSCFEPEARGHLVQGMPFHRFYFDLASSTPGNMTIASPHVRFLGTDVAVVSYVRLVQQLDSDDQPQTQSFEETRIWHRQNESWRLVHFHRSANA